MSPSAAHKFSIAVQGSISALSGKGLKDVFSSPVSPWATQQYAVSKMLPASDGFGGPVLLKIQAKNDTIFHHPTAQIHFCYFSNTAALDEGSQTPVMCQLCLMTLLHKWKVAKSTSHCTVTSLSQH